MDIIVEPDSAKTPADFEVSTMKVDFPVDESTGTVQVTIKDDTLYEGTEEFRVVIQEASVTHGELIITIQDNDAVEPPEGDGDEFVPDTLFQSGFVSRDVTLQGCDITRSGIDASKYPEYDTIEVYQQTTATDLDETAIKIAEIDTDSPPALVSSERYTFTWDPNSVTFAANLEIRNLNLTDSGYFWCVFKESDEESDITDMSGYAQILLRVNPCAGSNSSLATEENMCVGLDDLAKVGITSANVAEVSEVLGEATTRDEGIFTDEDILIVGDTIERIVAIGDGSEEVTNSILNSVNNILDSVDSKIPPTRQISNNSTTRIAQAVEQQVALGLQENDVVQAVESNLAVQGFRFNSSILEEGQLNGIGFGILTDTDSAFSNNSTRTYYKEKDIMKDGPPGYIFLTKDTVKKWSDKTSNLTFVFLAYRNDFLFPSMEASETGLEVEGVILTANVEAEETVNTDQLPDPVVIENDADPDDPERQMALGRDSCQFPKPRCVYWDRDLNDGAGEWSTEGCRYKGINDEGRRVCQCDHLTNFAVLVYHGKNTIKSTALDIVSKVGCGLSLAALVFTVIIFAAFRRLRKRARNLMIQLCISLIAVYLIFVVAIDRTCPKATCTLAAVLLHYFLLTTMAWMAVEARYLYIKLVVIFDPEAEGFVIKSAAVAYGIPAIIVAISLGAGFKHYQNGEYCFPEAGSLVVFLAILLPIALVIIHNLVCTVLIIKSIYRPRPGAGGRVRSKNEKQVLIERFRNSIAIISLLGLTWIFGFFAINGASLLFQWLFCIFNSFQGVFIFIFFCLKQKDVRDVITSTISRGYSSSGTTNSSTSGGLSSRTGKSDTIQSTSGKSQPNPTYDSQFEATPPEKDPEMGSGTDNKGLDTSEHVEMDVKQDNGDSAHVNNNEGQETEGSADITE